MSVNFYSRNFATKEKNFNFKFPLWDYFGPMIGDKKEVTIADLGAGLFSTTGSFWKDVKVNLYASDVYKEEYSKLWKREGVTPVIPIEYQNMESLTYPDNFFDIVHCLNALDHTKNPKAALREMYRVCKPGGWIYISHAKDQQVKWGREHYWNIDIKDSDSIFWNPEERFILSEIIPGFQTTSTKGTVTSILNKK